MSKVRGYCLDCHAYFSWNDHGQCSYCKGKNTKKYQIESSNQATRIMCRHISEARAKGYEIVVLNIVRDYFPSVWSAKKIGHISCEKDKRKQVRRGYSVMAEIAALGVRMYPVTYLGLSKTGLYKWLCSLFGVSEPLRTSFKDEDDKWWTKYSNDI